MSRPILILGAALFLLAASCSKTKKDGCAGGTTTFQLNEPFILCWGSTAKQAGQSDFSVKFDDLVEESRCPTDVTCVWAGRASVGLILKKTESKTDTLSNGEFSGTTHTDMTTFEGYKIKLLEVLPAPVSTSQPTEEMYQVKLLITQ